MKMCSLFLMGETPKLVDVSMVNDDHEFGEVKHGDDVFLHLEGNLEEVKIVTDPSVEYPPLVADASRQSKEETRPLSSEM